MPGFPRRGIPFPKTIHAPLRREPPKPFLKTSSGRRMVLYVFGLVALLGTLLKGVGASAPPRTQEGADSRAIQVTNPPKAFVAPEVLHQLRTIQDFTREPNDAAITTTVAFFEKAKGPEGPALEWTDLDIEQAVAHPEAFRGGLVRVSGLLAGVETLALHHPAIPSGKIYRGYLWCRTASGADAMVVWDTPAPPEFEKETPLIVEGAFLQAIQYEARKGAVRSTPFLVATAVRPAPPSEGKSILETLFVPITVSLIILILVMTLFLLKRSRKPAAAPDYRVRPPGPGR
jgi:hypothetical protein